MKDILLKFLLIPMTAILLFSVNIYAESEPNNSCSKANLLLDTNSQTDSGWENGKVVDNSDKDWYKVILTQQAEIKFERQARDDKKTKIKLYTSDCSTSAGWFNDGKNKSKTLILTAGTYYLKVWRSNKDNAKYKVRANLTRLMDLSVTKTVDNTNPSPGDTITYTITVRNSGPEKAWATITDTLPSGLTFKSQNGCTQSGNGIQCNKQIKNGDSETFTLKADVDNGTSGAVTNTANVTKNNSDDNGKKRFDTDLSNNSNSISITITPAANHPPSASNQSVSTNVDTSVNITLSGSDPDGDPIYYAIVTGPSHGTLSGGEPNLTYTPNSGYSGTDSFVYQVCEDTHQPGALCTSATVNITIGSSATLDFTCANPKEFSIIAQYNTQGNIKLIGNTNICRPKDNNPSTGMCVDPGDATNNSTNAIWRKGDTNSNTDNASAAKLELNDGATILWAGLYWQGYFQFSDADDLENAQKTSPYIKLGFTENSGLQEVTYTPLTADRINHVYFSSSRWYYQGFKDVTEYVKNHGSGWYWGADIATKLGKPSGGTLGAWSIAIIYQDDNEKVRNLTIFDGYLALANNADTNNAKKYAEDHGCNVNNTGVGHDAEMILTGFKTPREGDVSSRLIFFGGEGDIGLQGDHLWLMDKDGTYHKISNGTNPQNNIANSSITDYGVRRDNSELYPYYGYNTIGIDIDTFDASNIISNNQTQTQAKMDTVGDGYFPGIFGFSTDLYVPRVCYDFVAKRNEFLIPYKDHPSYKTYAKKDDEISFTIAIWDIKGDIDPRKVSIGLPVSQTSGHIRPMIPEQKAYYTITNGNILLPTKYSEDMSTTNRPVITIGKGRTDNTGGTISPGERYYTKFYFKTTSEDGELISGDYQVDINATFNYGSGDFWQLLASDRCDQNTTYSPSWVQFNVERPFISVPSDPTEHYSLPTRIAGKDFNYALASYQPDPNNTDKMRNYTIPYSIQGITVDVEMIDIGDFEDNSSYFRCGNSDPNIIIMPGHFVYFDQNVSRINVEDPNDLQDTYAVRNATFRMWLLTDENGTIITDNTYHTKNDHAYFSQVYENYYKNTDTKGFCAAACNSTSSSYTSPRGTTGCYACLRDYFAQANCARDNFAIRPRAIRVSLYDRGKDGNASSSNKIAVNQTGANPDNNIIIAAGYPYKLIHQAEDAQERITKGYTLFDDDYYVESHGLTTIPDKSISHIALLQFNDNTLCPDMTHRTIKARFDEGVATSDVNLSNYNNAGKYQYEIWDSNWTIVDKAYNNPYKTLFDQNCKDNMSAKCNDCVLTTTTDELDTDGKVGCIFSSELTDLLGNSKNNYTKLNLNFKPYTFILDLELKSLNDDWIYMNNLNSSTPDYRMSAKIEGNITAVGKDENRLSNFTDNCAAEDVRIWLRRKMSPDESTISDANGSSVDFQQVLKNENDVYHLSSDKNISTLTQSNFVDTGDQNGTAKLDLYYNFAKPYDTPVNVIDVNFSVLYADSPNAISNANQQTNYIPDGNYSITGDQNRTFFFAKVIPTPGTDGRQIYSPATSTQTKLVVDVYCVDNATIGLNCSLITEFSGRDETFPSGGGWYRMGTHSSALGDGLVKSLAPQPTLANLNITPSANIAMDSNGSSNDITISYPVVGRPVHPVIVITPDEWLKYNPITAKNGLPDFTLHFLNTGLRWKGVGQTGNVVETEPTNTPNKRIGW